MSDFDRNAATIDRAGRATSAVIDQGLRAYMLRVYNYMTLGLAITGLAALGIFMLSTTTDPALAGKVARAGAEVPAQIRGVIDRANAVTVFDLAAKRRDVTARIESVQHEIAAGGRKAMRRGQAEATYGSCDEGILASERAHAKGCWLVVW